MNKIEIALVNGADGSVDIDGTLSLARTTIENYVASRFTEDSTIAEAVSAVFDAHPGTRMNMPFVINQALQHMSVTEQPGSYNVLYKKVHSYIQDNSQGKTDKVTKAVENPNSLFVIGRGKNAGTARRADLKTAADLARAAGDSE